MTSSDPVRDAAALRFASRPSDDGADDFQRRRVALLAGLFFLFFGAISVAGALIIGLAMPQNFGAVHLHPGKLVSYGMILGWGAIWLILRRRRPSWLVHACDLAAVLSLSLGVAVGLMTAPPAFNLQFAGLLVGLLVLVMRAAVVPSRPAWTAVVGLLCAPGVLIGQYVRSARALTWVPPAVEAAAQVVWWLAVVAATTFVSRTIYGLVKEVKEARRLGQYTLGEKLGEGGMGTVYRAQHTMLRRPTAVKLLLPSRTEPEMLRRFEREVQLTSRLSHPNTIAIYDYGRTPEGVFYYAMEYLDGLTLERLVASDGPMAPGRAIHVLAQVAEALAEAHAVGLIHRDVKPANIMLCERGGIPDVAKVLDFGLVKQVAAGAESANLTSAMAITGTPLYMSPEAISSVPLDARADLYALGAVAYFLLTGAPPFVAATVLEICGHHLHTAPIPPSQRLGRPLPADLEALVLRCLAKDPAERPEDALELHAALAACQIRSPWSRAEARGWWSKRATPS